MKLQRIDLEIVYIDDKNKEVKINGALSEIGWQQWGQPKDILVENADLIEELQRVAIETKGFEVE